MKGVDEFVWVFVVAVIALVLFAAVGLFITAPGTGPGVVSQATNYTLLGNFSPGRVGFTGSSPVRTEVIGSFIAGEPQLENLKTLSEARIVTSLIGMEDGKYTINVEEETLPDVREVRISFDVDETNLYGGLIIKWNGAEVFNRKASVGHYSLTIDREAVKSANRLEIYAEGPGALFWASTVYVLKGFMVNKVSGLAKIYPFSMGSAELQVFDKGEVVFDLGKRSPGNKLLIEVNGIEIYNDEPALEESVSFSYFDVPPDVLKAGNNNLVFSTKTGSFQIEDAELRIYLTTSTQSRIRAFEMDSGMLGDFRVGILEFRVGRVVKPGNLEISINGKALDLPEIREGSNRVTFGSGILREGRNDIEFSGTGAFDIPEARIGFEK